MFYCFVDFVVFSYFVLSLWQTVNRMMKQMFWSETSPGCFHVFRRFHHICAFVTVPVLKRQEDRMRNRLVFIDYFGRCSVHWILSGQAFIKHSETNANVCGVRWCVGLRCLHSTCRFLVRKVSQITTANRPMCCRKPSRLKGNWDMFSIAIGSYIFLNQTWTKCE